MTETQVADFVIGADIWIAGLEPVNKNTLSSPTLKLVAKYGVGIDNVDLDEIKRRGIQLGWTGGVNRRSVSELALGYMISHLRNIQTHNFNLRKGVWQKQGGREISEITVGIVGFGNIGGDLAQILRPFRPRILYTDLEPKNAASDLNAQFVPYDHLIQEADVITFHVPSTASTKQMYGRAEIRGTKQGAFIINTSRGDIVNFIEVVSAVRAGALGGFAADVFPEEPRDLQEFNGDARFIFTPHIGGNSSSSVLQMGRSAISHVKSFLLAGVQ
jgi:D-3-phosphoglycerate dehydrogenase